MTGGFFPGSAQGAIPGKKVRAESGPESFFSEKAVSGKTVLICARPWGAHSAEGFRGLGSRLGEAGGRRLTRALLLL